MCGHPLRDALLRSILLLTTQNMGRRRKRDDVDDFDSSEDSAGSDGGSAEWQPSDPDEREEARLFRDPYRRRRGKKKSRAALEEEKMLGVFAEESDEDDGRAAATGRTGLGRASGTAFVKGNTIGPDLDREDPEADDQDEDGTMRGGLGMFSRQTEWDSKVDVGGRRRREESSEPSGSETAPRGEDDNENKGDQPYFMDMDVDMDPEGTNDEEGEPDGGRPRLGLGMAGAAKRERTIGIGSPSGSFSSRLGLGSGRSRRGIGSSIPNPERKTIGASRERSETPEPTARSAPKKVDKGFAKFEKHTKGFASKLMEKMGWKPGQGLGREGEGIVQPIDVKARPKNLGLAYNNFKEQTESVKEIEKEIKARHGIQYDLPSSEDEAEGKRKKKKSGADKEGQVEKVQAWKAGAGGAGRRKVAYKSAEELLAEHVFALDGDSAVESPSGRPGVGPTKIIDMTSAAGPREVDATTLKSVSASMTESLMDDARALPELRHNVRLIVDLCQHELLSLQKQKRAEDAKVERLRREAEKLTEERKRAEVEAARMARIGTLLEAFEARTAQFGRGQEPGQILDAFSDLFSRVERDFAEDRDTYRLDELCVAAVATPFQKLYSDWHPFEDPGRGISFFRRWRRLLMVDPGLGRAGLKREPGAIRQMTPYESLLSLTWLPRIRQVVNNEWNPTEPDALVSLLESWTGTGNDEPSLLPQWLVLNVLDQLVTPKLERTLAAWVPRRDGYAVHSWIHPWLPLFGDVRMKPLLDTVRQKMTVVLQDWKPGEDTAIQMLEPWKEVFTPADMESLVQRIVLPKLLLALRHDLAVNPARQDLKPIKWVLQWKDLVGINLLAHAFQTEFFPKWLWTLWQWLANPACNPAEVTQWYSIWKSPSETGPSSSGVFPLEILRHPSVASGFRQGLDLMNQAMELRDQGVDLAKLPPPVPAPSTSTSAPPPLPKLAPSGGDRNRRSASPLPRPTAAAPSRAKKGPSYHASIHDVIEEYFASKDLAFMPVDGRVHEGTGRALWRISRSGGGTGNASMLAYIDDGVLYCKERERWVPMSMEDAADRVLAM